MTTTASTRSSLLHPISSNSIPPSKTNKPRLYIALYPRGASSSSFTSSHSCDSFHWALVVGPQTALRHDPGTRYHLAHTSHPTTTTTRLPSTNGTLIYEENDTQTHLPCSTTLVRLTVAKVRDPQRATQVLRSIPITEDTSSTCLSFVKAAYTALIKDKSCLKTYLSADDWSDIERCARKYCRKKRDQRRFPGDHGPGYAECVSTFNFWENRETTR